MKLTMQLQERSYDIIIKAGALANLSHFANLQRKVLVVTDDGVPPQYAKTVAAQCAEAVIVTVPQGEESKSYAQLEHLHTVLLEHHFTRSDLIVAVGGGVVGDLAGFAAATYMRGIAFINCPTTTLAQIDSSIGGKTGINVAGTKNIVGAFWQPKLVVADLATLQTLAPRHFAEGLAEAIKAGLIADKELFSLFETDDIAPHIEEIIARSLRVKKQVVEEDETETGVRACLNFGHTLGHAIEALNLGKLYHGECVALGMLPMIEQPSLRRRVRAVYRKLGLPCRIRYNGDAAFAALVHDKKASGDTMKIITVPKLGSYEIKKVPTHTLRETLGEGIV